MDRTRESRRSSTNGFPKLRHRNIPLRDSSGIRTIHFSSALSLSLFVLFYTVD